MALATRWLFHARRLGSLWRGHRGFGLLSGRRLCLGRAECLPKWEPVAGERDTGATGGCEDARLKAAGPHLIFGCRSECRPRPGWTEQREPRGVPGGHGEGAALRLWLRS